MTRRWILAFAALALSTCKRDASPTTSPVAEQDGQGSGDATPPADASSKEPDAAADGTPPPTIEEVGVAECDRYLRAYGRCVMEHIPAESRDAMYSAMAQSAAAWREAAAGPNRDTLASACNEAYAAAKEVTASLGCVFE